MDGEESGLKTGKNVQTPFMDDLIYGEYSWRTIARKELNT